MLRVYAIGAPAIRTPVDVVANEDQPHRPPVCIAFAFGYEAAQGTQRAMNIANRIDPKHRNSSSCF